MSTLTQKISVIAGLIILLAAISSLYLVRLGSKASTGKTVPITAQTTAPSAGKVLLGAYPNSHNGGTQSDFTALEKGLGRNLAIDFSYTDFAWSSSDFSRIQWDMGNGTVPLVAWGSGGGGQGTCHVTAQAIIDGSQDATITQQALEIKALKTPAVFEFIPEPTDDKSAMWCFYGVPDLRSNAHIETAASAYIAAEQHVVNLFRAAGATNAEWAFTPDGVGYVQMVNGAGEWKLFYPGANYVDWIGIDTHYTGSSTENFQDSQYVQSFYSQASTLGKPLLIAQTAARDLFPKPDPQSTWISSAESSIPSTFPDIHAFVYEDNSVRSNGDLGYNLTPGHPGFSAFKAMADDPYFEATNPAQFYESP